MIVFDEQEVIDYLKSVVKNAFKSPEWRTLFGGKNIKIVDENFGEQTSFPVVYVGVSDCTQADGTYDNSGDEQYTDVEFEVECYNQEAGKKTKREIGLAINKQLMTALKQAINPHITMNQQLESPDESIYRRRIEGYTIFDNKNKIFYR